MTSDGSQVPWSDDQWARVNSVIQEEANRARVGAAFLPMIGPLPPDTDFVRNQRIRDRPVPPPPPGPLPAPRLTIEDMNTIQLATLQVMVNLRGAQMADPDLTSALALFRRAANVLARLEDAVVFVGLAPAVGGVGLFPGGPGGRHAPPSIERLRGVWQITNWESNEGLWRPRHNDIPVSLDGGSLVGGVSRSIGELESRGQFGPFAVVLDQQFFEIAQTPDPGSLVLPQDRIIPFLGTGGSLLRCSVLPQYSGVVVALGGAPIELVVATDMTLQFLQLTTDPTFVFRVFEKIVLRVKEPGAINTLRVGPIRPIV